MTSEIGTLARPPALAEAASPPRAEGMLLLAALSWVAAMIHAVVVGPHLDEFAFFGALFAGLSALQAACGALIYRRPTPAVLKGGALLNAGVVLVWIASRTTGLHVGPDGGGPEPVGLLGVGASVSELALVAGSLLALRRPHRAAYVPPWMSRCAVGILIFAGLTLVMAGPHHG